jgi:CSLREA domain-containing protein
MTLRAHATTFTVTKTADTFDGLCNADCSLRDAINAANSNGSGADIINFSTTGTISPTSALPAILTSLMIDGGTFNTYPVIELNGTSAGANSDGLVVQTPIAGGAITVTIKNLAINRFGRHGVFVNCYDGCNFMLVRSMLGTDQVGAVDRGNGQSGIRIIAYENSTFTIGTTNASQRNVISGNGSDGVSIVTASDITNANTQIAILNSHIGVNDVGNDALGNAGSGISLTGTSTGYKVTIGGETLAARNEISGNLQHGIYASSNQLLVYNNFIGSNNTGINDLGNTLDGIRLDGNVDATIGGTLPNNGSPTSLCNVISGNNGDGIDIVSHNVTAVIKRNYIGTRDGGNPALSNSNNGIEVKDSSAVATANILIGSDTDALDGNLISGNSGQGILIDDKVGGVKIFGNKIGINETGGAVPNQGGIRLSSAQNKIGKVGSAIAANVIAGNAQNGILLIGTTATGTEIYGNFIGTTAAGSSSLGNTLAGILVNNSSANQIGNGAANGANTIARNGAEGVSVVSGTNNSIRGNSIYANGTLGINLGPSGITPNDAGDGDSGANDLQNFPVVRAHPAQISGSLNSTPNSHFVIDYYRVDSCLGSGSGEGKVFLGSDSQVTTDQNGNAMLNFPVQLAVGQFVSATATQTGPGFGSTSEFSKCIAVSTPSILSFGAASYNIDESNPSIAVVILRSGGQSSGTFTVNYTTQDVTAKAGQDYVATSGTLIFADGEPAKVIDIPIIDDTAFENQKSFKVVLSNLPPDVPIGSPSSAIVNILDNDSMPTLSISDFQANEGNSGTKDFTFNVTLSAVSGVDATVDFQTAVNSPNQGDYQPVSGTLTFVPGETQKTIVVKVNGDSVPEGDEYFVVQLSNATNAGLYQSQATGKIIDDDDPDNTKVQFSQETYNVQEDLTAVVITVTRSGALSGTTTVDYRTDDGTANQKADYEIASGTLTFAPDETSKTFVVLINEDSFVEGTETVNLVLSNAVGANLDERDTAVLNILDDAVESPANPNDDAQNFVYQQYHDLLNREPDPGGLAYWTGQIMQCGNDQSCINMRRKDLSAAFYIELEFQETGYFVYRMQKASFGTQPSYDRFMADRGRITAGAELEQSKQAFVEAWVQRDGFKDVYPDAMPADEFVNQLYDSASLPGYANERLQAIQGLLTNTKTRAQVLRDVIETPEFKTREYNPSFVLMQYFAYLRRDPDQGGYQFWLNVVNNQLPNDTSGYHSMVCAFITSGEYQDRFSDIHTHGNGECGP